VLGKELQNRSAPCSPPRRAPASRVRVTAEMERATGTPSATRAASGDLWVDRAARAGSAGRLVKRSSRRSRRRAERVVLNVAWRNPRSSGFRRLRFRPPCVEMARERGAALRRAPPASPHGRRGARRRIPNEARRPAAGAYARGVTQHVSASSTSYLGRASFRSTRAFSHAGDPAVPGPLGHARRQIDLGSRSCAPCTSRPRGDRIRRRRRPASSTCSRPHARSRQRHFVSPLLPVQADARPRSRARTRRRCRGALVPRPTRLLPGAGGTRFHPGDALPELRDRRSGTSRGERMVRILEDRGERRVRARDTTSTGLSSAQLPVRLCRGARPAGPSPNPMRSGGCVSRCSTSSRRREEPQKLHFLVCPRWPPGRPPRRGPRYRGRALPAQHGQRVRPRARPAARLPRRPRALRGGQRPPRSSSSGATWTPATCSTCGEWACVAVKEATGRLRGSRAKTQPFPGRGVPRRSGGPLRRASLLALPRRPVLLQLHGPRLPRLRLARPLGSNVRLVVDHANRLYFTTRQTLERALRDPGRPQARAPHLPGRASRASTSRYLEDTPGVRDTVTGVRQLLEESVIEGYAGRGGSVSLRRW